MTKKEYETLKVGDVVLTTRGKNKNQKCIVKDIWDITDDNNYREIFISADYIDITLRKNPIERPDLHDIFISYKALKKLPELKIGQLYKNKSYERIIIEINNDIVYYYTKTDIRMNKKNKTNLKHGCTIDNFYKWLF